jgi:hypothetical protein
MVKLLTTFVESVTFLPALVDQQTPPRQTGFGVFLFDAFTRQAQLLGSYESAQAELADQEYLDRTGDRSRLDEYTTVRLANQSLVPFAKAPSGPFFFFAELPAGNYSIRVRSPYYVPKDVSITLPLAGWPAFPNITLANEDLPLDAATQPAAYRAQRAAATLVPSAMYPFPASATLIRGTVRTGGNPLGGASVRRSGDPLPFVTAANGDYVIFLRDVPGVGAVVNVEATHPLHPGVISGVQVFRGLTVLNDIAMV